MGMPQIKRDNTGIFLNGTVGIPISIWKPPNGRLSGGIQHRVVVEGLEGRIQGLKVVVGGGGGHYSHEWKKVFEGEYAQRR
jgi:pyruvate/2-oxoglutarate/acetoin dehydrogenase E1 component